MSNPIRLVIADDHPLVRSGIRALINAHSHIHLVAEATTGDEALHACRQWHPDVVLLDVSMPGLPTLPLLAALQTRMPAPQVLIFSANADATTLRTLLQSGVAGYLIKDEAIDELTDAIEAVAAGTTWFSATVRRFLQ